MSCLFDDMINMYESDELISEYSLHVSFVGERAIDHGGVFRNMISAFW